MKLWHDDVRPPPDDSWSWARTNEEAVDIILEAAEHLTEASLDHDLGYTGPPLGPCEECGGSGSKTYDTCFYENGKAWGGMTMTCPACGGAGEFIGDDVLYIAGTADETGLDLCRWMVEMDCVPPKVTVHSWNPDGALKMAAVLSYGRKNVSVLVKPYEVPART